MNKIKQYKNGDPRQNYQGDMCIIQIKKADCEFKPLTEEKLVVGHSESGHHHTLVREKEAELEIGQDATGFYVRVKSGKAQIVHEKAGGHEPQTLNPGLHFIGHQTEYDEREDRRVID